MARMVRAKSVVRSNSNALPDKIGGLLQESRWLGLGALMLFMGMALWGFHKDDPGWSHAIVSQTLLNPAGKAGAWLADLLLYIFGVSAWWWIVLMALFVWRGARRLHLPENLEQRPLFIALGGFALLLLASSALEALRFYTLASELPLAPGGLIGMELGGGLARQLGYTGSTIILLAAMAAGWGLFSGMSWVWAFETIGSVLEGVVTFFLRQIEAWQDRQIGKEVAQQRKAVVEEEKRRVELQEPVFKMPPVMADADVKPGPASAPPPAPSPVLSTAAKLRAKFVEPFVRPDPEPVLPSEPEIIEPVIAREVPPRPAQPAFVSAQQEPEGPPTVTLAQIAGTAAERPPERKAAEKPAAKPDFKFVEQKSHAVHVDTPPEAGLPPIDLLDPAPATVETVSEDTLDFTSRLIERKLSDFSVQVKVLDALPGPVITRYEIEPAVGVKGAQIVNLARDLARALAMVSIRVVETVPGKSCMALELPNPRRQMVKLSEIISSAPYHNQAGPLTVTLGKDIGGLPVVADLAKMPHLLVAGTTGSGKSVGVNAMILSILYKATADEVRMLMIDPKMLELSIYEGIPHLLAPVITDMKQAANGLHWCVTEMEKRYKLMSSMGVRNIAGLNTKIKDAEKRGEHIPNPLSLTPEAPEPLQHMPYIVVIIDELADLMMVVGKKVEELIARLAQKARAAGIHLVLATQRPSVDVITGLIKANIPTRIAFQVSSKIDSRTILDQMGAEALLGQGDMLYLAPGTGYPTRVHGAFVSDEEVHRVVEHLKLTGAPEYIEDILNGSAGDDDAGEGGEAGGGDAESDPLYDQAVEIVMKNQRASISLVQRQLRIGYNRSSRLIEAMENAGLVSTMDSRGGREVLMKKPAE